MTNPSRVKILESKYEEENDLIIWTLQFLDTGDEQKFCWPSVDLLSALGINAKKVDAMHLHKFCSDMINKEINFVVEGLPECKLPDTKSEGISEGLAEHFDTFRAHADG